MIFFLFLPGLQRERTNQDGSVVLYEVYEEIILHQTMWKDSSTDFSAKKLKHPGTQAERNYYS
jgi:hypothetical protein